MNKNIHRYLLPLVVGIASLCLFAHRGFASKKNATAEKSEQVQLNQPTILPAAATETTNPQQEETQSAQADPTQEILIGQSANFSGGMKLYGKMIQQGITSYFNFVNEQGGINGKKIRLISKNDSGDPRCAEENIEAMVAQGIRVFIGNMGTRNVLKVLPLIKDKKIIMLFPWGGDPVMRDPALTNIINGPGLIDPQIQGIIDYIMNNIKYRSIAIFHADDQFSTEIAQTATAALKAYNIEPAATSSYNRFTLNIIRPATVLLDVSPRIVLCLGTSVPSVKLINYFFEQGAFNTVFFGIDSTFMVPEILAGKGVNFYYSSAVPNPTQSTMPIAQEYLANIKKFAPDEQPNILSFTYYLCASILVESIRKAGTVDDRIIPEIEAMEQYNLGGFNVHFNKKNRHAFGTNVVVIKEQS